ncbi:RecBCD enzyme subunit RecB [BD1-7 clade bacterium]|uniref:RecBCD enzyme subunit RecB n=1 Tax=BD1-7 clade bacterium TaxID=2029982 RepID=A0A5S9Q330_9GAMM|nr:RecBCD enzyme subunit RecB [BD1-7 clade bacterium]CAA0112111.1 RecBCD enzyme subunit RecB [BD1-7 clade bacterium]
MQTLDLTTVPLSGISLIEASAGTGKTFTISNLVLRLILMPQPGLGEAPLRIDDVLVVTFTKAATQELKDRIRQRISDAEIYIQTKQTDDPVLASIVDQALSSDGEETIYERCLLAKLSVDDAPVFTIHGFCQRVLSDFGFTAGQPAEQTLLESADELLQKVVNQLWRETLYALDPVRATLYQRLLKSPDSLIQRLRPALDDDLDTLGRSAQVDDLITNMTAAWQQAREYWQTDASEICGWFAKGIGRSYTKRYVPIWLAQLGEYLDDESTLFMPPEKVFRFSQKTLLEKLADKAPKHALFDALETIETLLPQLEDAVLDDLRRRAIDAIKSLQSQQNILFFDDLIKRVARACGESSAASEALLAQLRTTYPAALIDEFQDTDQYQYEIFRRIYRDSPSGCEDSVAEKTSGTCMMMIGDPKQAIYSFRGADINTYFMARHDVVEQQRYTLNTNHRSVPDLVQGVNGLFLQADNPFAISDFPEYPDVGSPDRFAGRKSLSMAGRDVPITISSLDIEDNPSIETWRQQAAQQTAEFIQSVLDKNALIGDKIAEPRDIAILVRKGSQAEIMRLALAEKGINSVFLSNDSVLNTAECDAFIRLVHAVIQPFDQSRIMAALGDTLIGFDAGKLCQINQDASEWAQVQWQFVSANHLWKKSGFIVMWQKLMQSFDIAERLLGFTEGERRLTNLNQLAELFLARENRRVDFATQLHRFQQMALEGRSGDEAERIRLQSDANLVEIVTIHKSKGLEYPIVCCPFLFDASSPQSRGPRITFNADSQQRQLHWSSDKDVDEQLKQDAFSEDVRLLYVALTRAADHLHICWGPAKGVDKSALYALLYGRGAKLKELLSDTNAETGASVFWGVFDDLEHWSLAGAVDASDQTDAAIDEHIDTFDVATFTRTVHHKPIARSYSAVLMGQHAVYPGADTPLSEQQEQGRERDEVALQALVSEVPVEVPEFEATIFHFPRGSEAGNFMHLVLEDTDFQDLTGLPDVVEKRLDLYNFDTEIWPEPLVNHFTQCLQKRLPTAGCALSDLADTQLVKEMDFHLYAKPVDGQRIAELLAKYRSEPLLETSFMAIDGLFKGFIDLVFEHQGRYYVLDYKSNFLGYTVADYAHDAMKESIQDHDYDLQYLMYTAALQRYLRRILLDYDYETHIGGVLYLYLRGINDADDNGIWFDRPDAAMIDAFEQLFDEGTLA